MVAYLLWLYLNYKGDIMSDFKIEWTGLSEVRKFAEEVREMIEEDVEALVEQYALECQAKVRDKITENRSVITGNLRRKMSVKKIDRFTHEVYSNLEYAPYVEYGTRRSRAKPYIRPVQEELQPKFVRDLDEIVRGYGDD